MVHEPLPGGTDTGSGERDLCTEEGESEMIDRYTIHCGDCMEFLPTLDRSKIAALVSDVPFGMNWNTDSMRFSCGAGPSKKGARPIKGDDKPFDPSPWIDFPQVILWGSNHYAERLPVGTTLVWVKKNEDKFGKFLSDGEIGWQKGGHGVYVFSHVWFLHL